MKLHNTLLLSAFLSFSGSFILCESSTSPHALRTPAVQSDLTPTLYTFAEALSTIETRAYATPSLHTVLEQGLRGMLSALDAHSTFFTPSDYAATLEDAQGNFVGIGVMMKKKELESATVTITGTIPGSPAEKSGILEEDRIVAVNHRTVNGLTTEEVAKTLKGPAGSSVIVTLMRGTEAMTLTLAREAIVEETVHADYYREENVLLLRISSFTSHTAEDVAALLAQLKNEKKHIAGIILDLRKNPGGVLEEALSTLSHFIPEGKKVVETRDRENTVQKTWFTETVTPRIPESALITVLTDTLTASCAEIVAGALKYYTGENLVTALIIGEQTFGKGSVQEILPLSHSYGMKLTTQLYFLPDGSSVQNTGVVPDLVLHPRAPLSATARTLRTLGGKESAHRATIIHPHKHESVTEEKTAHVTPQKLPPATPAHTAPDTVIQTALTAHAVFQNLREEQKLTTPAEIRKLLVNLVRGDRESRREKITLTRKNTERGAYEN